MGLTCVRVQDGRVVETGNHDELVARPDSLYASLVRATELGSSGSGELPSAGMEGGSLPAEQEIEISA
jgi:hypothetical protein